MEKFPSPSNRQEWYVLWHVVCLPRILRGVYFEHECAVCEEKPTKVQSNMVPTWSSPSFIMSVTSSPFKVSFGVVLFHFLQLSGLEGCPPLALHHVSNHPVKIGEPGIQAHIGCSCPAAVAHRLSVVGNSPASIAEERYRKAMRDMERADIR